MSLENQNVFQAMKEVTLVCSVTVKTSVCTHLFRFQTEIENLSCEVNNDKTTEKIGAISMRFCYDRILSLQERFCEVESLGL